MSAKKLQFKPVHCAVDIKREIVFEPKGQDTVPEGERLRYTLKPPNKMLLEKVQNSEVEMSMEVAGDTHRGRVNAGTTRRLLLTNCLTGWSGLWRLVDGAQDEYEEVVFERPPAQPGSQAFEDAMRRNYEQVPEADVSEMVKLLRDRESKETVEKN